MCTDHYNFYFRKRGAKGKVASFVKQSHLLPFPQALGKRRGKSLSALNVK